MPNYPIDTPERIQLKIKQGRGEGEGKDYKPWSYATEFSSIGRCHQIKGIRTSRTHHLFSDGEHKCFLIYDCSNTIIDIREQYPLLPQDETLQIASELGIKHPTIPYTKHPSVFTTDFLLTFRGTTQYAAHAFKQSNSLDQTTLEKLSIERAYWKNRNIDWGIVTEREIPKDLFSNLKILHSRYFIDAHLEENVLRQVRSYLTDKVMQRNTALRKITSSCDERFSLEEGTSLQIAYHLIVRRYWLVDLLKKLNSALPLDIIGLGDYENFTN